jgi:hypothetical protein
MTTQIAGYDAPGPNTQLNKLSVGNDGSLKASVSSVGFSVLVSDVSSTVSYVGEAAPGSAASAAVWRIKKLDSSSGLVVTWASGNSNFDKVWNSRAGYSYS